MKLPIDIREISNASQRAREERELPVRVAVFVDPDAPEALLEVVRDRFRPQTSAARLHIAVAEPGVRFTLAPDADAVVALIGSGTQSMRDSMADAREAYVPVAALVLGEGRDLVARRLGHPVLDTLVDADPERLVDEKLGEWIVDRLSTKRLALATNFEFVRRSISEEAVKATSFQNAVIGLVAIIPGADMPLMIANQSKMLLQIAAAYGQPLGAERIKELAAVVGTGFAFRTIARELLAFVPGVGWAIKSVIAYTGTYAMGTAAIAYFERGADLSEVLHEARVARDRAVADVRARVRRGERLELPAGVAGAAQTAQQAETDPAAPGAD